MLPRGKLPDRSDFVHFGTNLSGRVASWSEAAAIERDWAQDWAEWLAHCTPLRCYLCSLHRVWPARARRLHAP